MLTADLVHNKSTENDRTFEVIVTHSSDCRKGGIENSESTLKGQKSIISELVWGRKIKKKCDAR